MKKVLLAIDGRHPDRRVFDYAVQLCGRIKAELNVLQIINPKRYGRYLKIGRERSRQAGKYFSDSFTAAAFAEAGEHETAEAMMNEAMKDLRRLLPESEKAGISCRLMMKSGDAVQEIPRYVNEHKGVVLTIYDAADEGQPRSDRSKIESSAARKIMQELSVPLVVVRYP
jgi:nucleotide-binding universal stress UspA family protein